MKLTEKIHELCLWLICLVTTCCMMGYNFIYPDTTVMRVFIKLWPLSLVCFLHVIPLFILSKINEVKI